MQMVIIACWKGNLRISSSVLFWYLWISRRATAYGSTVALTLSDVAEQGLRDVGDSIVLMGKNTMMKRSMRLYAERTGNESWNGLLDSLVGNVGLVFTKADLAEVRLLQLWLHASAWLTQDCLGRHMSCIFRGVSL